MGRANIYIHIKNEDKWANIVNKSDWVNGMLSALEASPPLVKVDEQISTTKIQPIIKPSADMQLCPNQHAIPPFRTHCLGKGCQYA